MDLPPPSSRRSFLGAAATAFAALGLPSALAAENAAAAKASGNGKNNIKKAYIYAFHIGNIEAWSISDGWGTFGKCVSKKMWPPEQRPAMTKALTDLGERPDDVTLYINVLVLRKGKEVVIVDAGFGAYSKNVNWGWLADALETIGIKPADVTHGLLSHSHVDHIGGFFQGNQILFPNAAIHVLKSELDFWRAPKPDFSKSHRTDDVPGLIKMVRSGFDALQPNLVIHQDGDQLLDGAITIIAAPGHTDGHAIYRIKDGKDSLLHLSDLAHNHVLMLHDPSWFIDFDHNPEQAIDTRRKVFAEIGATRERAYGFHLPWPGLGVLVPKGKDSYLWSAESWRWDV